MTVAMMRRRLSMGVELTGSGEAHVRVWAPACRTVEFLFGPDGNYIAEFSADYFTDNYTNDWGKAINFEGPAAVRDFFVENAAYWIGEYHFDGLRLDATQDINDASPEHVIAHRPIRA